MAKIVAKKRHPIRKNQVAELYSRLKEQIGESETRFEHERVELVETTGPFQLFLINKKPLLMEFNEIVFPTLRGVLEYPFPERRVVVDQGAVPFVVNGADVMRPGIVSVTDDIVSGKPVQIVEERHGKPIAIGIALHDAAQIRESTAGKMCRTIHRVGDELWNLEF